MNERYEIETLVISSLLQNNEEYQDILLSLTEDDFQDHDYRQIFINLQNGLAVTDLRKGTSMKPAEFMRLVGANMIPHTAYGYAEQLRALTFRESLITELMQLQSEKFDPYAAAERIAALTEKSKLNFTDDVQPLAEFMNKAVKEITENTDRCNKIIYSPYGNLNSLIGGLMPGKLITIAGRPGTGKSAFALQISLSVAQRGFKVLYISLEMPGTELAMRVFSTDTGISTITMVNGRVNGDELHAITESACKKKIDNLLVTNKGKNISEIRRLVTNIKPDLLIIDSLNLMQGKGESERIRVTGITRELKQIALQYETPLLMLAQLNREAEGQVLPTLNLLKESGSIEEDSDVVVLLAEIKEQKDFDKINDAFRESEGDYLLDPVRGFKVAQEAKDKIIIGVIAKNRNGALGKVAYLCKARRYAFEELPRGGYNLE